MRHLLSFTIYDDRSILGDDPRATLDFIGADGLELLTSYSKPDQWYMGLTESVHLPYATDWLAVWEGRPFDLDEESSRFYMFGRSRDEVVANVSEAIHCASVLDPVYGVFHATNGDICNLLMHRQKRDSGEVLAAFSEMVNEIASGFPGGEPPFRIMFENLWWSGLRLLDASDFRYLERHVEFEDWGLCIDTGHMMNCLPDIDTQQDGIAALERIFESYPSDLIDRVGTVHLHWSASYLYRSTFEEREPGDDLVAFMTDAFDHIGMIDQHIPFSDPGCRRLLDILQPDYVTHEMLSSKVGMLVNFREQRSLLP